MEKSIPSQQYKTEKILGHSMKVMIKISALILAALLCIQCSDINTFQATNSYSGTGYYTGGSFENPGTFHPMDENMIVFTSNIFIGSECDLQDITLSQTAGLDDEFDILFYQLSFQYQLEGSLDLDCPQTGTLANDTILLSPTQLSENPYRLILMGYSSPDIIYNTSSSSMATESSSSESVDLGTVILDSVIVTPGSIYTDSLSLTIHADSIDFSVVPKSYYSDSASQTRVVTQAFPVFTRTKNCQATLDTAFFNANLLDSCGSIRLDTLADVDYVEDADSILDINYFLRITIPRCLNSNAELCLKGDSTIQYVEDSLYLSLTDTTLSDSLRNARMTTGLDSNLTIPHMYFVKTITACQTINYYEDYVKPDSANFFADSATFTYELRMFEHTNNSPFNNCDSTQQRQLYTNLFFKNAVLSELNIDFDESTFIPRVK